MRTNIQMARKNQQKALLIAPRTLELSSFTFPPLSISTKTQHTQQNSMKTKQPLLRKTIKIQPLSNQNNKDSTFALIKQERFKLYTFNNEPGSTRKHPPKNKEKMLKFNAFMCSCCGDCRYYVFGSSHRCSQEIFG